MNRHLLTMAAALMLLAPVAARSRGSQWKEVIRTSRELRDISFPDRSTGYAVGGDSVWKSTDGGGTWTVHPVGSGGILGTIYFTSPSTGFVAGEGGIIMRTTDGGEIWSRVVSGTQRKIYDMIFTTGSTGFAVSDSNTLLTTQDGGINWSAQVLSNDMPYNSLISIHFADEQVGYIAGSVASIFRTTDGGEHWTQTTPREPFDIQLGELFAVFFTSPSVGFAASQYPWGLYRTLDSGTTWTAVTGFSYPASIDFPSQQVGYYACNYGQNGLSSSFRSTDGGNSWSDSLRAPLGIREEQFAINSMAFLDDSTGFAVAAHVADPLVEGMIVRLDVRSEVSGVAEETGLHEVAARPGNEPGSATIDFTGRWNGPVEIRAVNVQGIVVEGRRMERVGDPGSLTLNVGTAGVYVIEISTGSERIVRKVVVE